MELLAILGRGIQRETVDGPWVLTEDLEMCDEKGVHLPVRAPIDDKNPICLIGGGNMNLDAGCVLIKEYCPPVVVCAYGGRSPYLDSVNGPSESEVMSELLGALLTHPGISPVRKGYMGPQIIVWPREKTVPGPSNTNRELQNIFELAVERGFKEVGVVTVAVHWGRTLLMAKCHLAKQEFSHLKFQCYVSENVLIQAYPEIYGPRIRAMHGSKAFMRSMFLENRGTNRFLEGTY